MKLKIIHGLALLLLIGSMFGMCVQGAQIENEDITTIIAEPIVVEASVDTTDIIEEAEIEEEEPDIYEIAAQECRAELDEIESIGDTMEWYIAYKDIVAKYSDVLDPPESIYDAYTEDEIYLMCRVIETEVYQAPFDAKVNVANVILNRINSGDFGESVTEVCTAPGQFVYGRKIISDDTILALEYAFQIVDTTKGAVYFHSNKVAQSVWNNAYYVMTDEVGHHFYATSTEEKE